MITLTLLHPVQGTAVQSWTFKQNETVRIGRAVDNEVVLYSAVVSRHHVELRFEQGRWFVHSLGVNGTFLEGEKVKSEPLKDGNIIRLARSGPNIQVNIQQGQGSVQKLSSSGTKAQIDSPSSQSINRKTQIEMSPADSRQSKQPVEKTASSFNPGSFYSAKKPCTHDRTPKSSLICIDCGEPINVLKIVGDYKILKSLGDRNSTFLAWKQKKTYVLRTLPPEAVGSEEAKHLFKDHILHASQLNHGGIPRMLEIIQDEGQDYLVSEMIYGTTLENWVKERGTLSIPSAISWISDLAKTLDYLHQLNPPFIHQSVKPSNVIRPTIPQGDHPLLLVNFGQFQNKSGIQTQDRDLAFQPPSRGLEGPSISDDLYGLGATFLFMLTGSDPYKYIQLGDQSFRLNIDEPADLPDSILEIIGSLLQSEGASPIQSVDEALEQFFHLM